MTTHTLSKLNGAAETAQSSISRRLLAQAKRDVNRARWAYSRHAAALVTALEDWRHAVEAMERATAALGASVQRKEGSHDAA